MSKMFIRDGCFTVENGTTCVLEVLGGKPFPVETSNVILALKAALRFAEYCADDADKRQVQRIETGCKCAEGITVIWCPIHGDGNG